MAGTLTRSQTGSGTSTQAPQYNPVGLEVPFLVNNKEKWISGIVEETTCGDVVKALLAAEGRLKGINEEQLDKFVMVERWRKVERPLKRESCLLKIWQAWGPEAQDVQFILKRVSSKGPARRSCKVKRTNSKLIKQLAEFEARGEFEKSKCENEGSEVQHMQGNIQALLKIIISQRETIQSQLGTLKAKDMYLKTLDKSLSCSDGREYVLRNYLEQIPEHAEETLEESQDSGCGSGNDTQDSCTEANTPDHTVEATNSATNVEEVTSSNENSDSLLSNLFEKLFRLNQKLEVQEDDIFRLTLQMETMLRAKGDGEETLSREQESLLHSELQVAQEELDTMAKLNSRLGYEIKRNELALTNMMKNYDGRKQFAKRLEQDVSSAEGMTASSTPPTMGTGTATTTAITTVPVPSLPSTAAASVHGTIVAPQPVVHSHNNAAGLNRIDEETDWEEGCETEEEESDDEELLIHRKSVQQAIPFPVLAPPEQFQNCLSPSATYESGGMRPSVASPAYSNDSVSSALSSSTATEKSVRFSDRDHILSTPEPRPGTAAAWWRNLEKPSQHQHRSPEALVSAVKVKSILKPEPPYPKNYVGGVASADVTSFLLDREDGTLV